MNQQSNKWKLVKEVTKRFNSFTGDAEESTSAWIKDGDGDFDNVALMTKRRNYWERDAKLIAHAPELLEKLKECANVILSDVKKTDGIIMLLASIDDLVKEIEG